MRIDLHRLFAREIAAGVQGIDPDIHERTAACVFSLRAPLVAPDVESKGALDGLNCSQPAFANQLDRAQVYRFEMAAVADHQLLTSRLRGSNHGSHHRNGQN